MLTRSFITNWLRTSYNFSLWIIFSSGRVTFSKVEQQHKVLPPSSVLRQVLNGSCEAEVTWEELSSPGQHQLVTLPDGDVGNAGHVGDLPLRPLVVAGLACHVDGGRSH